MESMQASSTLCEIPGEIRNRIYELWACDLVDAGMGPSSDHTGEATLLRTCRLVHREARHFYYSTYTLDFANLRCLDRFLVSRSQSSRQLIKHVKVTLAEMAYEYDALDLLATCTGLETLMIDVGINHLTLDSPGVFALRKIRGLRSLRFSGYGWTYTVPQQIRKQLRRDMTKRTMRKPPYPPSTFRQLEKKYHETASRRYKLQSYERRMASLRTPKQ